MRHRLAIIGAACLWSTSGLFVKSPLMEEIEPVGDRGLLIATWRCLFAALALLPFFVHRLDRRLLTPRRPAGSTQGGNGEVKARQRRWWMALLASFAAMNLLFVAAMTRAAAGDVIFLQYMAPLWVVAAGVLLLHERLERDNLVALGLGLAGVLVIVQATAGSEQAGGALLALGAGGAYAGVILSLRRLKGEDPFKLILAALLVSWFLLLPWAWPATFDMTGEQWLWIAALGVVQMAAPYLLFAWGLKGVTAQEGALLTLVEPVLNPLWVYLAWGPAIAIHTLLGGALILAGLGLRYGRSRPKDGVTLTA